MRKAPSEPSGVRHPRSTDATVDLQSKSRTTTTTICCKHRAMLKAGRERLRPNTRGQPVPPRMNRCNMRRPKDPSWSPSPRPPNHPCTARAVRHSGSFVWVHAFMRFSRVGRKTPVRTEPLPTALSVALCSQQILLVPVVVVLDFFWGSTPSARLTRAARFGRSLSLPP
jgi:hypothetical protein